MALITSDCGQIQVGGRRSQLETLRRHLEAAGVGANILRTSTAFHTAAVDPLLESMGEALVTLFASRDRGRPDADRSEEEEEEDAPLPTMVSTLTGEEMPADGRTACTASYWLAQMREPVRFAEAVRTCSGRGGKASQRSAMTLFVEVGPMDTLTNLTRMVLTAHDGNPKDLGSGGGGVSVSQCVSLLPHAKEPAATHATDSHFLNKLGGIWAVGLPVDFQQVRETLCAPPSLAVSPSKA